MVRSNDRKKSITIDDLAVMIKHGFDEVTAMLNHHTKILGQHSENLAEHSKILTGHGSQLSAIEFQIKKLEDRINKVESIHRDLFRQVQRIDDKLVEVIDEIRAIRKELKRTVNLEQFETLEKRVSLLEQQLSLSKS